MTQEVRVEFEIKPGIVHVIVCELRGQDWKLADNGWAVVGPNALRIATEFAAWAVTELAEGRELKSNDFHTTVGK